MMRATASAAHKLHVWLAQTCLTLCAAVVAAGSIQAGAEAAARADFTGLQKIVPLAVAPEPAATPVRTLVWKGADVDGDGAPDFVNPTGHAIRQEDAYGFGTFGARRDGGTRQHEGVDFIARPGQAVSAPISGFVTKIGLAYADDEHLQFVEITNPAIGYVARVFYIDPTVAVGDVVRMGQAVGRAHSLQDRYPLGMTDHVHLELMGPDGKRMNTLAVLKPRYSGQFGA
jgi:murein DD-endopeptidase MepM/ murein hydrolase activator NlpD